MMFSIPAFALATALASAFVARADVTPSEPSPGSAYPEGGTCPISWEGDRDSTTIWKSMNIELMTGDNFNMKHITTVTTGQDGTVNGHFEWPCPDVTLNSAVYFYQFSSPLAGDKEWTTRFAISSPDGATTPPPNATQPGTSQNIPWGVGDLADPSKAVAAPSSGGSGASGSVVGLPTSSSNTLIVSSSSSTLLAATPDSSPIVPIPPASSMVVTVISTPSSAPSVTDSNTGSSSNGAIALSLTHAMGPLVVPALALMFL